VWLLATTVAWRRSLHLCPMNGRTWRRVVSHHRWASSFYF